MESPICFRMAPNMDCCFCCCCFKGDGVVVLLVLLDLSVGLDRLCSFDTFVVTNFNDTDFFLARRLANLFAFLATCSAVVTLLIFFFVDLFLIFASVLLILMTDSDRIE